MKTRDFARALTAFAELAEFERSDELYRLATYLAEGENEATLARLKQMSPATSHPSGLKKSLETIRDGLLSIGARKQAAIFSLFLKLFGGRGGATLDRFLEEISAPPAKRLTTRSGTIDLQLAKIIVERLNKPDLSTGAFEEILAQLRSYHIVNTPTLVAIANRFLHNRHLYRDRRKAIDAIVRHQERRTRPAEKNFAYTHPADSTEL